MDPQTPQTPPLPPTPPVPPQPPVPAAPEMDVASERPPLEAHPALQQVTPTNPAFQPLDHDAPVSSVPQETTPKAPKTKKRMGKFIIWPIFAIIFGALCFAPLTPGIVVPSLPGNSDSLDAGAASQVDCGIAEDPATTHDELSYQNKKGLPLSYNYSKVVSTSFTCDSTRGKEFLGSTSVVITNRVAIAVDAATVVLLASVVTLTVSRLRKHA